MEIEILSPKKEGALEAYEDYARKFPRSNIYSSLLFGAFFSRLTEGSQELFPYYLVAKEEDEIIGILPSVLAKGEFGPVLNSMPWFGSNPGVMADSPKIEWALLEYFIKIASWTDCLSATLISRPFQTTELYDDFFRGVLMDTRVGLVTELPDQHTEGEFGERMYAKIHQKTRNQIVQSINRNEPFRAGEDADEVWEFIARIHRVNMEAIGAPVKSKEFEVIRRTWRQGTDYDLYFSKSSATGDIAAALLVAYFGETADYFIPAIDVDYRPDNPMHCLIFHAMKIAAKAGYKYWNWGGTKLPEMESVYHFKKRWGAEECEYKYYTMMLKPLHSLVTKERLLAAYPNLYVLPFKNL